MTNEQFNTFQRLLRANPERVRGFLRATSVLRPAEHRHLMGRIAAHTRARQFIARPDVQQVGRTGPRARATINRLANAYIRDPVGTATQLRNYRRMTPAARATVRRQARTVRRRQQRLQQAHRQAQVRANRRAAADPGALAAAEAMAGLRDPARGL